MGVSEELPVGASEGAVAVVEVKVGGKLIVMADQEILPPVAVKVGNDNTAEFHTGPMATV